jgi:hypothetical protein
MPGSTLSPGCKKARSIVEDVDSLTQKSDNAMMKKHHQMSLIVPLSL